MSLNINQVRNGRIYSVVFNGAVRMNKGGRGGVAPNPLQDLDVTRRMVVRMQACSRASYRNRMLAQDPDWQPSGKPSSFSPTTHPCVDTSNATGEASLRLWSLGVIKNEIFVGGRPATPEQLATIAAYKPAGREEMGFMRFPLAKLECEGWDDSQAE